MARFFSTTICMLALLAPELSAQVVAPRDPGADAELKYVVYFSRHGVRSPTGKSDQYSKFSSAVWPEWEVAPGLLTPHGYHLMELFGAYDRMQLAKEGLFSAEGCSEAGKVTFYADSDQRTRETGKALAKGMFPGCDVPVAALAEGTNDPLFHLPPAKIAQADSAQAVAAIAGRIGNDPNNPTESYRRELVAFDKLLATCGTASIGPAKRTSLLDIPPVLSAGQGDHIAEMRGPINTASTLAENILLEYTNGKDTADVGWGCVDGAMVKSLIALHTAATDFAQRTPAIARPQAANALNHIRLALEQAVEQHPVAGAPGKSTDRALFLIGHDTNLENMAGALTLNWVIDGRRDDTPPGGALVFELWKKHGSNNYDVRVYFTAQTLEQMRSSTTLTLEAPPQRVPVFIPGCSRADFSCDWLSFSQTVRQATGSAPESAGKKAITAPIAAPRP